MTVELDDFTNKKKPLDFVQDDTFQPGSGVLSKERSVQSLVVRPLSTAVAVIYEGKVVQSIIQKTIVVCVCCLCIIGALSRIPLYSLYIDEDNR